MKSRVLAGIEEERGPRLEIASLIDMSFLMLVFFMVAATLQKQEADLNVLLPGGAAAEMGTVRIERMLITVDDQGTIALNGRALRPPPGTDLIDELAERLRRYGAVAKRSATEPQVLIDCADAASEQRFIDVLGACRRAGIDRISILDGTP